MSDEFTDSEFSDELEEMSDEDFEFSDEDLVTDKKLSEDLEDDDFSSDEFATDLEELDGDDLLGNHEIVSVDITYPLTMEEAQELTNKIRSTANIMWVLIARAHAGKAWEALGYPSFAAYVQEEFNISRSRAYQLLDQSKVINAIEAATPEGTDLNISEKAARDLKSIIGEIVPEIEERTSGASPDEASDIVDDIIKEYREKKNSKDTPDFDDDDFDIDDLDDLSDLDDFGSLDSGFTSNGGGGQGGSGSGGGMDYSTYGLSDLEGIDDELSSGYDDDEDDDIDPAEVRRNVQAAYDLYASLSALEAMPEVMNVINTIPEQRRIQINDSLDTAVDWLTSFRDQWKGQEWYTESSSPSSDSDDDLDLDLDEYEFEEDE